MNSKDEMIFKRFEHESDRGLNYVKQAAKFFSREEIMLCVCVFKNKFKYSEIAFVEITILSNSDVITVIEFVTYFPLLVLEAIIYRETESAFLDKDKKNKKQDLGMQLF